MLENGCDALLVTATDVEEKRVRETGRFGRLFFHDRARDGVNAVTQIGSVVGTMARQKRFYRHKTDYLRYARPESFFEDAPVQYGRILFTEHTMTIPQAVWTYHGILRGDGTRISCWEHSLASYLSRKSVAGFNLTRRGSFGLSMELCGVPQPWEKVSEVCLFRPELCEDLAPDAQQVTVPPVDRANARHRNVVNRLYDYAPEDSDLLRKCKYVFFDQSVGGLMDGRMSREVVRIIQQHAVRTSESLAVKPHPLCEGNPYPEYNVLGNRRIPWEVHCLNMDDLDGKALLTVNSAAPLMTKLYFDAEPYVVDMSAMFSAGGKEIVDKLRRIYRNPEKIHSIASPEDLTAALNMIAAS